MQFRRLDGWGVAVQADMLSDKRRGAHPSPPKGREPDTQPQPLPKGGGQGTSTYTFRRICYPPAGSIRIYYPITSPLTVLVN